MTFIRPSRFSAIRGLAVALFLASGLQAGVAGAQSISSVAGGPDPFNYGDGGPATAAALNGPYHTAWDSRGNMYIADRNHFRVRKVDAITGVITTVAGNGNSGLTGDGGLATAATLRTPESVALDAADNLYIADPSSNNVRKVNLVTGIITKVAGSIITGAPLGDGGPAIDARLNYPNSVAVDAAGNIYISDWGNNRVRMVEVLTGKIYTVAGNGTTAFVGDGGLATAAGIHAPEGIALDSNGALYVADSGNGRIRKVSGGVITTVAGNGGRAFAGDGGPATSASLFDPMGVAVDRSGNVYVSDTGNHRIRKVSGGVITTFAGNGVPAFGGDGGPAISASIASPRQLAVDANGDLHIADFNNDRIRKVAFFVAQTITFPTLPTTVRLPGDTVQVSATASSGLPVTFSSLTLSVCTVSGTTVTLVEVGNCRIAADQAGDAVYGPAPRVTQSFLVGVPGSIPQSITFVAFPTQTYRPGQIVSASATASSGLAVTFSSMTLSICTVTGSTVSLVSAGNCTIAADQAGDSNFVAAAQVTQSLVVSPPATGPDAFVFVDQNNVLPGALVTSNAITVIGIPGPMPVTVENGYFSVACGGPFTSEPDTIFPGQTICVRHNASLNPLGITATVLTIGTTSATFRSTTSSSYAGGFVAGYYRSILGREGDVDGQAFWEGEAARMYGLGANVNESWRAMAISFFGSAEYRARNRTNDEFVVDLYNTFFNRPPDAEGLAYWSGEITSGIPREVAIISFLFSGEYKNYMESFFGFVPARPEVDMVVDFYRGFLGRLPDSAGFDTWVMRFRAAQCTSVQAVQAEAETISREFFTGAEYQARGRTNLEFVSDLYNGFMRRGADLTGVNYWQNELNTLTQTRDQLRRIFLGSPEFQERLNRVAARGCT